MIDNNHVIALQKRCLQNGTKDNRYLTLIWHDTFHIGPDIQKQKMSLKLYNFIIYKFNICFGYSKESSH